MQLASVDERGTLEQISFALLLIRALDRRWTGTLVVGAEGEAQHVIEMDRGLVCRVLVPDEHARLGELMVDAGVLKEGELEKALARPEMRIGRAFVEAGLIDDKTLERALVLQLLRRLERLFGLSTATPWAFGPELTAFEGMPPAVRIDTLRALWAGLSAHGEMGPWLDASLERIGKVGFTVRRDVNLRRFGFTGDARKLVRVIRDERVSLEELVARNIAPEEVCRQIVYLLAVTRYLDFSSETANDSKPPLRSPASDSVDEMASISDEPTTEDTVSEPPDSADTPASSGRKIRPPRRVARIALRRVAVARGGAAPDPPGSGDPSSSARGRRSKSSARFHLLNEIQSRLVRLEQESPFQLLALDPQRLVGKSEEVVTEILWEAYEVVARRWHPDECPDELAELREGMAKIHEAASDAFALLSDPATRKIFMADFEPSAAPSSPQAPAGSAAPERERAQKTERAREPERAAKPDLEALTETLSSETGMPPAAAEEIEEDPVSGERAVELVMMSATDLHARALMALSEQKATEALRLVKSACKAEPNNPDFLATSAWIRAAQPRPSLNVLLMDLDDLLDRHPSHVSAIYYRGVLRRRVGDDEGARKDFEAALAIRPDHDGAQAELADLKKAQRG